MAGGWKDYDQETSDQIQQCSDSGERTFKVSVVAQDGKAPLDFTIDLEQMTQVSPLGDKSRKIRAPYKRQ